MLALYQQGKQRAEQENYYMPKKINRRDFVLTSAAAAGLASTASVAGFGRAADGTGRNPRGARSHEPLRTGPLRASPARPGVRAPDRSSEG